MIKFKVEILQTGKNTGIPIAEEILESLKAGRRPALLVKINGFEYRTTVGSMNGKPMISLSAENRNAAGVNGGELHEVEVELATAPEPFKIPEELQESLTIAGVTEKFNALAPSKKKEFIRQVVTAVADETRQRRIIKIVASLT